jgi:uncharacterized protein YjbI with pentapeptide repeats
MRIIGNKYTANRGTNLRLTNFSTIMSKLKGAFLQKVNLQEANLIGANLEEADLTESNLIDSNLIGARLQRANLTNANLQKAKLQGAILSWANLTGTILTGADLRLADLTGTNLKGADLTGVFLTEEQNKRINDFMKDRKILAIIRSTNNTNTKKIFKKAHLNYAVLNKAYLKGADLEEAELKGAILTGANLEDANLTGANLEDANLTGANLTGANLTGAILTGAILTGAILTGAILTDLQKEEIKYSNISRQQLKTKNVQDSRNLSGLISLQNLYKKINKNFNDTQSLTKNYFDKLLLFYKKLYFEESKEFILLKQNVNLKILFNHTNELKEIAKKVNSRIQLEINPKLIEFLSNDDPLKIIANRQNFNKLYSNILNNQNALEKVKSIFHFSNKTLPPQIQNNSENQNAIKKIKAEILFIKTLYDFGITSWKQYREMKLFIEKLWNTSNGQEE